MIVGTSVRDSSPDLSGRRNKFGADLTERVEIASGSSIATTDSLDTVQIAEAASSTRGSGLLSANIYSNESVRIQMTAFERSRVGETSRNGVFCLNGAHEFIYVSDVGCEIFGSAQKELLGRSFESRILEGDRSKATAKLKLAILEHAPIGMHVGIQDQQGNSKPAVLWMEPIWNAEGNLLVLSGTVSIVTGSTTIDQGELVADGSARRCKKLCDSTPAVMHSVNAKGKIVSVSDKWLTWLGYEREEVIGHHILEFMGLSELDERGLVKIRMYPWVEELSNYETVMVSKSGELLNVSLSTVIDYHKGGEPAQVLSVIEDITQRKQYEAKLLTSRRFLARTGQIAGVGGWELTVATQTLTLTDTSFELHGIEVREQISLDELLSHYSKSNRALMLTSIEECLRDNSCLDIEIRYKQPSGTSIWLRVIGSVEWMEDESKVLHGVFRNVTKEVNERNELKLAQERTQIATCSGGIGIWELSLRDGQIHFDERTQRLYGFTPPKGKNPSYQEWSARIHPEDLSDLDKKISAAVELKTPMSTNFRVVLPSGEVRYLRGAGRVICDSHGTAMSLVGAQWDVTESMRITSALTEQNEMLRVTLASIGDAVITTDDKGNVSSINLVAERLTGWSCEEAKGKSLDSVIDIRNAKTLQPVVYPLARCIRQGETLRTGKDRLLRSRNGKEYGVEDTLSPIRDENGNVFGAVIVLRDVTERHKLMGEMRYRATHDDLTGLVNRAEFESQLAAILSEAKSSERTGALLFIDLDQFKLVNDTCGHAVGDELLKKVSKLLGETIRSGDTLARLGGDEFAVILEDCNFERANEIAQEMCTRMDIFRFSHEDKRFRIGASVGLVPLDARWDSKEDVMKAADAACYAAKEAGRNRVHKWLDFDAQISHRTDEMRWTTRIEHALDEDRFALYAQRIVDVNDKEAGITAEVLVRLVEPNGEVVPPGAFLPAAERFHLATRIDKWVVKNCLQWMSDLPTLVGLRKLSINLSGQSVGDREFQEWAIERLRQTGPEICARICFEITETSAITNMGEAVQFIARLRMINVSVALDDFGAGTASFGYLKSLPVQYLKIDGQFIRDLTTDRLDDAAVRCFVDVAQVMNIKTVAEFVDQDDVLQRLKEIGVDFVQGFLIHKPEPISCLQAGIDSKATGVAFSA